MKLLNARARSALANLKTSCARIARSALYFRASMRSSRGGELVTNTPNLDAWSERQLGLRNEWFAHAPRMSDQTASNAYARAMTAAVGLSEARRRILALDAGFWVPEPNTDGLEHTVRLYPLYRRETGETRRLKERWN